MSTPIDPRALVRFVRDQGPVTVSEVRFAFTHPTEEFTAGALQVAHDVTGEVEELAGYWAAVVVDTPAQGD